MEVVSLGPLRASSLVWQPRPGAFTLTVACKATFVLAPHESPLADAQDDLCLADAHWNDDRNRSLRAASDLAPFKPRADVTLVGHACAANGRPTASLVPRMIIGTIDKAIEALPDRAWTQDGVLREGPRFLRMPLVYERAAGGPGTVNPVGVRPHGPPDRHGRVTVPNLQAPGVHLSAPGQYVEPVGFGPIAAWWPSRLDRLHRHGSSWSHREWHQHPLPSDLDFGYFNAAPPDQQVDALRSNERLVLEDLHADHPRLVTSLPGISPRAVLERRPGAGDELPMHCDTLGIDMDRGVCWLVWRGQIMLERPNQEGRVLISTDGRAPRTAALPVPGGRKRETVTADFATALREATLPFREGSSPSLEPPFAPTIPAPAPSAPASFGREQPSVPPPPAFVREQPSALPPPAFVREQPSIPPPPSLPVAPPPALFHEVAAVAPAPPPPQREPGPVPPPPPARGPLLSFGQRAASEAAAAPAAPSIEAGAGSVLAASNLAAATAAASQVSSAAASPEGAASQSPAGVPLELIWHDPAFLPRIRKHPPWTSLMTPPPKRPPPKSAAPPPPDPPEVVEQIARTDLAGVLGKGEPARGSELDDLVATALGAGGSLTPPLILVVGELELPFDEIETLRAVVATASPLAAADPKLREVLDLAGEMLKTELRGAPDVVDNLVLRVSEAWSRANRLLPPTYLETHAERVLIEKRAYQKRELLDATWIRALIHLGPEPVPAYLPVALAKKLPLFRRFPARAVAEALPQQDQYERRAVALRVAVLAREVRLRPRAG